MSNSVKKNLRSITMTNGDELRSYDNTKLASYLSSIALNIMTMYEDFSKEELTILTNSLKAEYKQWLDQEYYVGSKYKS